MDKGKKGDGEIRRSERKIEIIKDREKEIQRKEANRNWLCTCASYYNEMVCGLQNKGKVGGWQ